MDRRKAVFSFAGEGTEGVPGEILTIAIGVLPGESGWEWAELPTRFSTSEFLRNAEIALNVRSYRVEPEIQPGVQLQIRRDGIG